MKVLFLDFDGVINTCMWYWKEDGTLGTRYNFPNHGCVNNWQAVQWVSEFCQKYDFKIVISSTWRRGSTLSELKEILKNSGLRNGIEVVGKTPILDWKYSKRGDEISLYLEQHPEVTEYIIFDDDSDMTVHMGRLIQTDGSAGFGIKEFGMASKLVDLSENIVE